MVEIEGYNLPDEIYYHKDHTWARVEDNDKVRVGLSDFAQKMAGEIVYVDLPFEGDQVKQGETCAKVQSSKWIGKIPSPVSGEIIKVNYDLDSDATIINKDPYGKGWVVLLRPTNLEDDLKNLYHKDAVGEWIKSEIVRVKREIEEKEKGK